MSTAAGINSNGQHFVRRGAEFAWVFPELMRADDLDCTFMDDEQFEQAVREVSPA